MFYNLIDNIKRCTKVRWKVSAQDDQIPHVNSWIRFWARGETFPHNHFHYFVESWEEPRGLCLPQEKMKNTENIVFAVKTQASSNASLWGSRRFCQVIRQRGTRETRLKAANTARKNNTKSIAGMFCDLQWLLLDMRRPPSPLAYIYIKHQTCQPFAEDTPGQMHPSQRSTHDSWVLPFIVIVTWKQISVISNDLYKTSKMHIKTAFMHFYNLHLKFRTTQQQLCQSNGQKATLKRKTLNKTGKSENMENKMQRGENT